MLALKIERIELVCVQRVYVCTYGYTFFKSDSVPICTCVRLGWEGIVKKENDTLTISTSEEQQRLSLPISREELV